MAHFRGTIEGTRGKASRLGTKNSGLTVKAQTWGYDLQVSVRHIEARKAENAIPGQPGRVWPCEAHDLAEITLINHTTGERRALPSVNLTTGEILK